MDFDVYESYEKLVEAGVFDSTNQIGNIVDNLFQAGCKTITVTSVPRNPQLEDTTYVTSISFVQNGVVQSLFEGDVLSFDEEDNVVVWNYEDFLEEYELVEGQHYD